MSKPLMTFENRLTTIYLLKPYALYFQTNDQSIVDIVCDYYGYKGNIRPSSLAVNKNSAEGLIDFICGTKWPEYLHEFMSQVVEALTNDRL